jgi:hypothetical protein
MRWARAAMRLMPKGCFQRSLDSSSPSPTGCRLRKPLVVRVSLKRTVGEGTS